MRSDAVMPRQRMRRTGDATSTSFPSLALRTLPESANAAVLRRCGTVKVHTPSAESDSAKSSMRLTESVSDPSESVTVSTGLSTSESDAGAPPTVSRAETTAFASAPATSDSGGTNTSSVRPKLSARWSNSRTAARPPAPTTAFFRPAVSRVANGTTMSPRPSETYVVSPTRSCDGFSTAPFSSSAVKTCPHDAARSTTRIDPLRTMARLDIPAPEHSTTYTPGRASSGRSRRSRWRTIGATDEKSSVRSVPGTHPSRSMSLFGSAPRRTEARYASSSYMARRIFGTFFTSISSAAGPSDANTFGFDAHHLSSTRSRSFLNSASGILLASTFSAGTPERRSVSAQIRASCSAGTRSLKSARSSRFSRRYAER